MKLSVTGGGVGGGGGKKGSQRKAGTFIRATAAAVPETAGTSGTNVYLIYY